VVADLESEKKGWLKKSGLLRYFGSALIVSVAYFDPGNFGTDIAGGAAFNYDLLCVVWLAIILAFNVCLLIGSI
jgi:manganese transport protein